MLVHIRKLCVSYDFYVFVPILVLALIFDDFEYRFRLMLEPFLFLFSMFCRDRCFYDFGYLLFIFEFPISDPKTCESYICKAHKCAFEDFLKVKLSLKIFLRICESCFNKT